MEVSFVAGDLLHSCRSEAGIAVGDFRNRRAFCSRFIAVIAIGGKSQRVAAHKFDVVPDICRRASIYIHGYVAGHRIFIEAPLRTITIDVSRWKLWRIDERRCISILPRQHGEDDG